MSNRVQRNCLNPALVFTLLLYDFIVVCTFDIIHQFLVPTIWNSVSCRFVSSIVAEENWTLFKTASTKKCQMKFFYLMDSCHSNFLSNLRLKWGTKNGAKESSDPDKIRIEHSIAYLGLFCPEAKQPITYLSIFIGDWDVCLFNIEKYFISHKKVQFSLNYFYYMYTIT